MDQLNGEHMGVLSYIVEKKKALKEQRELTPEQRIQILEAETQQAQTTTQIYTNLNQARTNYEENKQAELKAKHPILNSIAQGVKQKFTEMREKNAKRNIFAHDYVPEQETDNVFTNQGRRVFGTEPYKNPFKPKK